MALSTSRLSLSDTSEKRLILVCGVLTLVPMLYIVGHAIYNLYFHPLHKYPGPKSWIAFPILRHLASVRGVFDKQVQAFHEKYGDVVRYSPDQLSFITAQAWKDIYGHSPSHPQLPKAIIGNDELGNNIITANEADHIRFRRSLAHAFSEKALAQQEPLMKVYIDLLISKLTDVAASVDKTDIVEWYNLTTFDLIGDLAFGAPFDGLKDNHLHDWIRMIFDSLKLSVYVRTAREYPVIMKLLLALMPASVANARNGHRARTRETTLKRMTNKELMGRGDFMDAMLRHRGEKDGLTDQELINNASILIIAGSETTATLLSGVTYWLLRTPDAMRKVTEEVRSAFETEDEINFIAATAKLPYMLACLNEAFRIYPPVPTALQRIVPPGPPVEISGFLVPPGTLVAVHQSAAYHSAHNFTKPTSYIPERWLPNAPAEFANDKKAVVQPFSVGPRNCIGRNLAYNEMRLILARILWNFDLELCWESLKWQEVQKTYTLWEKPPMWVTLRPRGA